MDGDFSSIRIDGGMFSPEFLQRVADASRNWMAVRLQTIAQQRKDQQSPRLSQSTLGIEASLF